MPPHLALWLLAPFLGAAAEPLLNLMEERLATARSLEIKLRTTPVRILSLLSCALFFLVAFITSASIGQLIFRLLSLSLCWIATMFDLRYRIIPNELIFSLLALAAVSSLLGFTGAGILSSLGGFWVCGALFVVPFFFGKKVGGGDVKLAAAIGLCAGLYNSLLVIALMGILVFIYSVIQRGTFLGFLHKFIPMGPFITAAYFLLLIR